MRKIILVVEDNELNMQLVKCLLPEEDYEVLEAADAKMCFQQARKRKPDLILMDIQLPDIDGLTAMKTMREDPLLGDVPVVILSSYSLQSDKEDAQAAGCSGYITKPIDIQMFLETIEKYLE